MKKAFKYIMVFAALVSLTGCNIYKKYELPEGRAIVDDYKKAVEAPADSASLPMLTWEQVFTDTVLQKLIRAALNNNRDLDNAKLNIDIAHAQLKGAKLSYFPAVSFGPNGGTASYGGSTPNWSYSLPLAASWEIDVFGKILNSQRAAQAGEEMAQDYAQAVRSQIVCGVANCYYTIMLLNQQLNLSERTAEIWKEQVESMVLMKEAARVNEAAVVQSRANYYSILASIPDLKQQIVKTQNSLSLLLNTYPQTFTVSSQMDFNLPTEALGGVPMQYLAQRPDVRAAERSLAQAYYATAKARSNFYPSLVISAQGGFTNLLGSMVVNPGKWFWQLAGSLTAPVFSRGANIAQLEAAKAQQQQALNKFEYSVLSAASDVSNALVSLKANAEKREMLLLQIDQLEKSVEYTEELLTLGRATYLEVLTARSSLLNAQLSSLSAWYSKVSSLIALYQAVGGASL